MGSEGSPERPDLSAIGAVTQPAGFRAAGTVAGLKESGLPDLGILVCDVTANAAAVFTRNVFKAAPLLVDEERIQSGRVRAIVVNSGNANAGTGRRGIDDARKMAALAAAKAGCPEQEVLVYSTGVIGRYLPMERIAQGIEALQPRATGGGEFARAILTTDTFVKEAVATFEAGGTTYTVGGCCKGAGMIHPNMATLLAYLTTDAPIAVEVLQERLRYSVERSFNMVTVDGDTSTSDSVALLASGAAGGGEISAAERAGVAAFSAALEEVSTNLARDIARDGEGATKLIEVRVEDAATWEAARDVGRSIVRSPLLKAALSKGDPNWGRVLMAAGNAGVAFDPNACRVWLGDSLLFEAGGSAGVPEAQAARAIRGDTVRIRVSLGQGTAAAVAWGCDLTEEYVRFNADYVT